MRERVAEDQKAKSVLEALRAEVQKAEERVKALESREADPTLPNLPELQARVASLEKELNQTADALRTVRRQS